MDQLIERIKNEHVTLIDVMPKKYYELQHIPGSSSIPLDELEKNLPTLPLDKEVVAYCRGRYCLLSVQAVKILKSHGYKALLLEERGDQGDGSLVSFGDLGLFTEDPFSCLSDDTKTDSSQSFNLPDRQPFAFAASEHFVPL